MNIDKELLIVEQEIADFKTELSSWDAFDYGLLCGERRILEKLKEEKKKMGDGE